MGDPAPSRTAGVSAEADSRRDLQPRDGPTRSTGLPLTLGTLTALPTLSMDLYLAATP